MTPYVPCVSALSMTERKPILSLTERFNAIPIIEHLSWSGSFVKAGEADGKTGKAEKKKPPQVGVFHREEVLTEQLSL